jgi:hypothetical protein
MARELRFLLSCYRRSETPFSVDALMKEVISGEGMVLGMCAPRGELASSQAKEAKVFLGWILLCLQSRYSCSWVTDNSNVMCLPFLEIGERIMHSVYGKRISTRGCCCAFFWKCLFYPRGLRLPAIIKRHKMNLWSLMLLPKS